MKRFLIAAALLFCSHAQAQTSFPISQGNISASTTNCSVAFSCVWQNLLPANAGTTTIAISGTFSATLLVEESNNSGQTWATAATLSAVGTTTYSTNGFSDIRVRCSAFTSGTATVTINTGLLQVQSVVSSSSSGGSIGAVFNVLNYGWIDDDSTDNCGTPVTSFLAAVNSYSGPGIAQVIIPEGAAGKAYKLVTCNLIFTAPRTLYLWGTIDCAQSGAFTNCIQEGPSNLVNFTNAQTPPYTIDGTGVLTGCVNVTVACIEAEPWVSNPRIKNIHFANTGAGNGSPPACSNYAISFDGHNNAPQIIGTEYWNTDGVTGRCWSINNRTGAGGGTNSAYIAGNTIVSAGAAPGFTAPCGSVGHSELGAATLIVGNQFYGFGQPILAINPVNTTMISENQIDQAGCTFSGAVASADIHLGNGSNGAVSGINITSNYFPSGAGHSTNAVSLSAGSTSTLSNIVFSNNQTPPGNAKQTVRNFGTCNQCTIFNNPSFEQATTCAVTGAGTGGTCTLLSGTDTAGVFAINTGTTPSSSGTVTLTFASGTWTGHFCMFIPHNNASSWNARASFVVASGTTTTRVANWDNNAVALTGSQSNSLAFDYYCMGN